MTELEELIEIREILLRHMKEDDNNLIHRNMVQSIDHLIERKEE